MLPPDFILRLAEALLTTNPDIKLSRSGSLLLATKTLAADKVVDILHKDAGPTLRAAMKSLGADSFEAFDHLRGQSAALAAALRQKLSEVLSEAAKAATVDLGTAHYPGIPHPLSEMEYVFDQENPGSSFLRHPASDTVFKIHSDLVESTLERVLGKAYGQFLDSNSCQRLIQYRPFAEAHLVDPAHPDQPVFNCWKPAEWDRDWRKRGLPKTACPPVFARFLRHLFPTEESRQAAEAWHRDAAFGKSGCAMVLSGTAGSGKSTYQSMAKYLVGPKNYTRCSRKFFDTRFQGIIAAHRLAIFDELRVTADIRDSIKDFLEPEAVFDEKYQVMRGVKKIYCSIALASNYSYGISLEYTDRKFSVPDIATKDLKNVWESEEIAELMAAIKDPKFIGQYAAYLYHEYAQGQSMIIPKGPKFERLCMNSYDKRFRAILDQWKKGVANVSSQKINRNASGTTALLASEVEESIEAYQESRGVLIGKLSDDSVGTKWNLTFLNQPGGKSQAPVENIA